MYPRLSCAKWTRDRRVFMSVPRFDSALLFVKAAKADVDGTIQRTNRGVDAMLRYPGLCRTAMG